MLVVVHQGRDVGREHVMLLQGLYDVTIRGQVVESLDGVKDVRHAMIRILFEVAHCKLTSEIDTVLERDVVEVVEVLVLEQLEREEL